QRGSQRHREVAVSGAVHPADRSGVPPSAPRLMGSQEVQRGFRWRSGDGGRGMESGDEIEDMRAGKGGRANPGAKMKQMAVPLDGWLRRRLRSLRACGE